MSPRRYAALLVAAATVLVSACGGAADVATGPPSPTPTPAPPEASATGGGRPPAPGAPPKPAQTPEPPAGCAGVEGLDGFFEEFEGPLLGDLDGDGGPDEVYLDGPGPGDSLPRIAVLTGAGARLEVEVPTRVEASVLGVADADGNGRDEIFVERRVAGDNGVGSSVVVSLAAVVDCELTLVTNVEGDPYDFRIDEAAAIDRLDEARGVGCVDADFDGGLDLIGFTIRRSASGDGHEYERTIVQMDGAGAANGETQRGGSGTPFESVPLASCGRAAFDQPLTAPGDQEEGEGG